MKYIKTFNESKLNEGLFDFIFGKGFPKDKSWIQSICNELGIRPHVIHEDGTVDVDGDLLLNYFRGEKLPLKFGRVYGDFEITSFGNLKNKFTTLEGSPHTVDGEFSLKFLKGLSSLEGGPIHVGAELFIVGCPLTSLEGSPERVRGRYTIAESKITSLKGLPSVIEGTLHLMGNAELFNPEGISDLTLGEEFVCGKPLLNIFNLFGNFDDFRRSLDYKYVVYQGGKWKISLSRFREALGELDLPLPDNVPMYEYTD